MKHYPFSAAQAGANMGFTDLFIVDHTDATVATDNTDQAVDLDALEFGDLVGYEAMIEIGKAWNADVVSADCVLAVSLGVNAALTQFVGASTIATAGAGIAAKTCFATAAAGTPYAVPTGGKTLQMNLDITDADGALADFTAGELWIWMKIWRFNTRKIIMDSTRLFLS